MTTLALKVELRDVKEENKLLRKETEEAEQDLKEAKESAQVDRESSRNNSSTLYVAIPMLEKKDTELAVYRTRVAVFEKDAKDQADAITAKDAELAELRTQVDALEKDVDDANEKLSRKRKRSVLLVGPVMVEEFAAGKLLKKQATMNNDDYKELLEYMDVPPDTQIEFFAKLSNKSSRYEKIVELAKEWKLARPASADAVEDEDDETE